MSECCELIPALAPLFCYFPGIGLLSELQIHRSNRKNTSPFRLGPVARVPVFVKYQTISERSRLFVLLHLGDCGSQS